MLHKDPIEVGAVDAGVAGGVRNADRIGIIIFQVFFCFCKILQRGLGIRVNVKSLALAKSSICAIL